MDETLLKTENLYVEYRSQKGITGGVQTVKAVNDLTLEVKKGEVLAIAGESGCGKSTLAKALIRLIFSKKGKIFFNDKDITKTKDLKDFRKQVQMVFQNPYASLNPKMKIKDILKEPLIINTDLSSAEIYEQIIKTIKSVGLDIECLNLYPHEFSGGQRQRIAIARALILNPKVIIADEPVSALDVSIQAQIINLLNELKEKYSLTIIFISHDLSVIRHIADRIAVMYLGEIVEIGKTEEIFTNPHHPYTKVLLNAVPSLDVNKKSELLQGDLPSPENLPDGCKFHTRCSYCMDKCEKEVPDSYNLSDTHFVKCFLND